MAIKPPELLNRLPSVSELLEKPQIRALADRWNRSVVAGRVQTFLDELRNDLRRRAAEVPLPSIRELAERAAGYVISREHASLGSAVNATGQIWGTAWSGLPMSDSALERVVAVGREFSPASREAGAATEVAPLLCRLAGTPAAAVTHSYAGALWVALAALATQREVLVARAEVGAVGPDDSLVTLAAAANATLREVGTTNRAAAADYEVAASPQATVVLKLASEAYRIVGETASAGLEELAALARDRELVSIAALGAAPPDDLPEPFHCPLPSAKNSAAAGIDLTIIRGDGLLGGPACGILVGRREIVDRVTQHPLFAMQRLDLLRSNGLIATLECHESRPLVRDALPLWQIITAPLDNLRNRAERLAPQLAQAPEVAQAVAVETRSPIAAGVGGDAGVPSYGILLASSEGDVAALDRRLRSASPPIYGRVEADRVLLDLRTVLPRQDTALVAAVVGTQTPESETVSSA